MAIEKGKGAEATAAEKGKGEVVAAAAAAGKGKGGRPTAAETEADYGRTIKLKSSDERIFEVPAKVAKLFRAIADVVDKGYADDTVPLPNVHSSTLAKVIEYCDNHLRTNADPDVRGWDKEFVSKLTVNEGLLDLDHQGLLDLICKAVADMMAGRTAEQIRAIFGIENDFTPEEEAEIAAAQAWGF